MKNSGFLCICLVLSFFAAVGCENSDGDETASDTGTDTATETDTNTATATVTDTGSDTATATVTDTGSDTATATVTDTGSDTATATVTDTGSDTATATVTDTGSDTATATVTDTDSDTATATDTGSDTATATDTGSDTDTVTDTDTDTDTETETDTATDVCGGVPIVDNLYTVESDAGFFINSTEDPSGEANMMLQTFVAGVTTVHAIEVVLLELDVDLGEHNFQLWNETTNTRLWAGSYDVPYSADSASIICFNVGGVTVGATDELGFYIVPSDDTTQVNQLGWSLDNPGIYADGGAYLGGDFLGQGFNFYGPQSFDFLFAVY